jgi:signal peptidase I
VSCFSNNLSTWWRSIISSQRQAWLTMRSGSMYPLMPTGAQILVKAIERSLIRVGDIVLYVDQNQLIAHRIFKVNLTQNYCLQGGDNALVTSVIPLENIIGVVEKIRVNGKEVDLKNRTGRLLTRFMIFSLSGVMVLKRRWPKMGYLLHRLLLRVVGVVFT